VGNLPTLWLMVLVCAGRILPAAAMGAGPLIGHRIFTLYSQIFQLLNALTRKHCLRSKGCGHGEALSREGGDSASNAIVWTEREKTPPERFASPGGVFVYTHLVLPVEPGKRLKPLAEASTG